MPRQQEPAPTIGKNAPGEEGQPRQGVGWLERLLEPAGLSHPARSEEERALIQARVHLWQLASRGNSLRFELGKVPRRAPHCDELCLLGRQKRGMSANEEGAAELVHQLLESVPEGLNERQWHELLSTCGEIGRGIVRSQGSSELLLTATSGWLRIELDGRQAEGLLAAEGQLRKQGGEGKT